MKKLLPALFLVLFINVNSQTLILTKAANDPIIGDTGRAYLIDTSAYAGGLNVSLTGSNTVWTYTNLITTSNSITSAYIAPASAPNATNYAGCTIVEQQGSLYSYYKNVVTPSVQTEFMGIYSPSITMSFTNTAISAKYPFTFGNTFTDAFAGSFNYVFPGTSGGNATVTADGTGTLNLPDGTLSNVLRVKSSQVTTFTLLGSPGSIEQTVYNFYHASQKFPVLTIDYTTLTTGNQPTLSAQVTGNKNNFTVGIKENYLNNFIAALYPNPAIDILNIETDALNKPEEIRIYNQSGQIVYSLSFTNKINIGSLVQGFYFIEIKTKNGIARKKFIKE